MPGPSGPHVSLEALLGVEGRRPVRAITAYCNELSLNHRFCKAWAWVSFTRWSCVPHRSREDAMSRVGSQRVEWQQTIVRASWAQRAVSHPNRSRHRPSNAPIILCTTCRGWLQTVSPMARTNSATQRVMCSCCWIPQDRAHTAATAQAAVACCAERHLPRVADQI